MSNNAEIFSQWNTVDTLAQYTVCVTVHGNFPDNPLNKQQDSRESIKLLFLIAKEFVIQHHSLSPYEAHTKHSL